MAGVAFSSIFELFYGLCRSLNMEALMNEAHLPFRQLLQEVPDPEARA